MQDIEPKLVNIKDPDLIASVIYSLIEGTYAVGIILDDAAPHHCPVLATSIDPARDVLLLSVSASEEALMNQTVPFQFGLLAQKTSETLRFDQITAHHCRVLGEHIEIECEKPTKLQVASKRSAYRIPLAKSMPVPVSIVTFKGTAPLQGILRNLSLGGCLVQLPINDIIGIKRDETLAHLRVTFPNGETLCSSAQVKHMRIEPNTNHALIGVQFTSPAKSFTQQLWYVIREIEREVAIRKGNAGQIVAASELFKLNDPDNVAHFESLTQSSGTPEDSTPMVVPLKTIARQLNAQIIALQNGEHLASDAVNECAISLLALLHEDRQAFFYALSCLNDQTRLIQHSLNVAGKLADLLTTTPQYATLTDQIIAAALIHDLGKPLLLSNELKSLTGVMSESEKSRLRAHPRHLFKQVDTSSWLNKNVALAVLGGINERLDGSGYPLGLKASALPELSRMAMVVDVIDALTRPRDDRQAWTALEAYRYIHDHPEKFDAQWLTRYIKRHGFLPIGSLIEFSHGFLAWVMALDENGRPSKVRVVRNMSRPTIRINEVLSTVDFYQLGEIKNEVKAERYKLLPF
ncbi:HD domain-containing phosphohydrolase [Phytohalomonas tamaricis]|uniref:HD domain-containing phosphohydrolase n=1 Tax=Phytohalomonas tamaricis TaxID=2081032 RepID=UPI000D0ADA79|nr:HD domain-containing phosphohydrolase [Phytohalomonas tamaricis]